MAFMTRRWEVQLDQIVRAEPPPQDCSFDQLTPELLLWAYRHTMFPMNNPDDHQLEWFSPDPRGILPLSQDGFHVPRNVRRDVRKGTFEIRSDTAFEQVMRGCAVDRSWFNPTWINDQFIHAYVELHRKGHAHSIEAWRGDQLVGGLYGVHIGGAFFGESMFSQPAEGGSNSSKICLVHLVRWLRTRGFSLLDTQFWNEHLDQFGCIEIPAPDYWPMLQDALQRPVSWGQFTSS